MDREDKNSPVEVFIGDSFNANMVKNILENENIPALIYNEIIGTILPVYSSPLNAIKVMVPREKFEMAKTIVKNYNDNSNS